jgi:flavodoxin
LWSWLPPLFKDLINYNTFQLDFAIVPEYNTDIKQQEGTAMAKTLIAFFSRADENYFGGAMRYVKVGNTEVVCGIMERLIGADSFKIEMVNPYSPVYMTCIEQAKKDLRENARPELVSLPESIDAYDTIVLAYPNYWGTMPMAVVSFLEHFDFTGKTILPLCTNEGSGMGSSEGDIKKYAPGAEVRRGLSVTGSLASDSENSVRRWLGANGLM